MISEELIARVKTNLAEDGRIVLDGPAGSGKSTVARETALALGANYLNTGSMYRAATVRLLELGVDLDDQKASTEAVAKMQFSPSTNPLSDEVIVDGKDVHEGLHSTEVSALVSKVATNLEIRKILVKAQQEILQNAVAAGHLIVAEGRDLTTVVAPDAPVRAIITARPEVRIARRGAQLGQQADDAKLRDTVLRRDQQDATVVNFETPAPGVALIDNSDLTITEAITKVLELAEKD
ncbi:(d)CMP kinase [Boudabousia liubingyangii]|uniref:(d)CMP kinase n=1 Tax=Boudabousia liubingyangii TaxID=1921764 RepID=UPI000A635647|nr:(d)CMP kinase [Boudabousia liubingyangii]